MSAPTVVWVRLELSGADAEHDAVQVVNDALDDGALQEAIESIASGLEVTVASAAQTTAPADLLAACAALVTKYGTACIIDALNPCWNGRPADIAGKHWGGGDACEVCVARASIEKARGA